MTRRRISRHMPLQERTPTRKTILICSSWMYCIYLVLWVVVIRCGVLRSVRFIIQAHRQQILNFLGTLPMYC